MPRLADRDLSRSYSTGMVAAQEPHSRCLWGADGAVHHQFFAASHATEGIEPFHALNV